MRLYFLGIGGIGMSALARFFKQRGDEVCGYDHAESPLTHQLEAEGIAVHYDDNPEKIPADINLCVYTPAVPKETAEYQYIAAQGIEIRKRSQVLGELTRDSKCIAVAGSHGKTTTSAMIAHLLHSAGVRYSCFLGGISKNLGSNMHSVPEAEYVVVEADEYDRSFLQLHPHMAVITSTDPDHLDIYGTHENLLDAFYQFAHQVDSDGGHLFIKEDASLITLRHPEARGDKRSLSSAPETTFYNSDSPTADHTSHNLRIDATGAIHFDMAMPDGTRLPLTLNHSATYNVENAVAACAVALRCGLTPQQVQRGLATFEGVQRRFDYHVHNEHITYIDDYAHHPRELAASIRSAHELFPGRHLTGIFQPHLYSRTADFAPQFAEALSALDRVILLDIYPARELPIPGVSSRLILDRLTVADRHLYSNEELLRQLPTLQTDVLLTLGAGDIDRLVPTIENIMKQR